MKKFKPVIASFVVVLIALGGMLWWKHGGDEPGTPADNTPDEQADCGISSDGYEFEVSAMEKLPHLDPPRLWPRDGRRMAAPRFWVIWTTSEFSKCRLWASHGEENWVEIGNTAGINHCLLVDLSDFDSEASFMVDFTERGKRYRSHKRRVSFGRGARFRQREYTFDADEAGHNGWIVEMQGRDTDTLTSGDFLFDTPFLELQTFATPAPDDSNREIRFRVDNPDAVPAEGCHGFLEVYDNDTATFDRTLIRLIR